MDVRTVRWLQPAALVAASCGVALGRIDQTLGQFQLSDYPAGGIGDLASPAAAFDPALAIGVAAGWAQHRVSAPAEYDQISALTTGYVTLDGLLMLCLTALLSLWLSRAASLPDRLRLVLRISIAGYLLFDAAETVIACVAWGDYGGWARPVGFFSIVKWVCLAGSVLVLSVFSVRDHFSSADPSHRPWRQRLVGDLLDGVLRFRAQLVIVGFLTAVFLLLASDLGRQVDDVLVRAAERWFPAALATVFALVVSVAIAVTCSRCDVAYRSVSEPVEPDGAARRRGFWISTLLLVALGIGAFTSAAEWRGFFLSGTFAAGAAVLVFVRTIVPNPPASVAGVAAAEIGPPGFIRPLLIVAPLLVLELAIVRAMSTQILEGVVPQLWIWLIAVLCLLGVVLRAWPAETAPSDDLEPGTLDPAVWLGILAGMAMIALAFLPASAWMEIGTPAVLFLWATLATFFLAGLVVQADRWPLRGPYALGLLARWPVLSFLLVWSLVASAVDLRGAYYDVRLREPALTSAPERPTIEDAYTDWLTQAPATTGKGTPLVFVAAAGGGIRAAYWTAISWACLFEADCGEPGSTARAVPSGSVFLASGVSGGSLGLASIRTRELRGPGEGWPDDQLVADFVAPALAAFLFRDLPNSLLRIPTWQTDRAGQLEAAWESADPGLADSFHDSTAGRFPHLILNSTSVEDGCRLAVSTIDLDAAGCQGGEDGSSARFVRDAEDFLCDGDGRRRELKLSTAALLSARFPYVSPAGGLTSCADNTLQRDRTFALDGGILDNSGAGAIQDVWRSLEARVRQTNADTGGACVIPRLVIVDNGYAASAAARARKRPIQGTAPLAAALGFYDSRSAREVAALEELIGNAAREAETTCSSAGKPVTPVERSAVVIRPQISPGTQAPLGWTLSTNSVRSMRQQLRERKDANVQAVQCWFSPGPC